MKGCRVVSIDREPLTPCTTLWKRRIRECRKHQRGYRNNSGGRSNTAVYLTLHRRTHGKTTSGRAERFCCQLTVLLLRGESSDRNANHIRANFDRNRFANQQSDGISTRLTIIITAPYTPTKYRPTDVRKPCTVAFVKKSSDD